MEGKHFQMEVLADVLLDTVKGTIPLYDSLVRRGPSLSASPPGACVWRSAAALECRYPLLPLCMVPRLYVCCPSCQHLGGDLHFSPLLLSLLLVLPDSHHANPPPGLVPRDTITSTQPLLAHALTPPSPLPR